MGVERRRKAPRRRNGAPARFGPPAPARPQHHFAASEPGQRISWLGFGVVAEGHPVLALPGRGRGADRSA
ncbi:MAG: hypothetical protein M3305_00190 [Actinomycetota bacterium]|nr:hypothetical protein [Actinomycetota bacterium]